MRTDSIFLNAQENISPSFNFLFKLLASAAYNTLYVETVVYEHLAATFGVSACSSDNNNVIILNTDCFCCLTASFYCFAFDFTSFCYFLICIFTLTVACSSSIVVHNSLNFWTILLLHYVCNAWQVTLPFLRSQFTFYCFMDLLCLFVCVLFFFFWFFLNHVCITSVNTISYFCILFFWCS